MIIVFANKLDVKGYRVVGDKIVGNSGRSRMIHPLSGARGDQLFLDFANIKDAEDVRAFCDRFGNIGTSIAYARSVANWFDEVLRWRVRGGKNPPNYLTISDEENDWEFALLRPKLSAPKRLTLQLEPHTLIGLMTIQLAQSFAGSGKIKSCVECGKLFMAGTRTNRRAHSKFCSPLHQRHYNNKKTKK
jgi:hypothetical protein